MSDPRILALSRRTFELSDAESQFISKNENEPNIKIKTPQNRQITIEILNASGKKNSAIFKNFEKKLDSRNK